MGSLISDPRLALAIALAVAPLVASWMAWVLSRPSDHRRATRARRRRA
jgi:hypothetical protein